MSTVLAKWTKQPLETLDYDISFVDFLAARGDALASHSVVVDSGITLLSSAATSGVVKLWLTGGTNGTSYKVTCTAVTSGGRTKEAEILIKVKEY